MRNSYWLIRHGRSLANEAGIIVSLMVRLKQLDPPHPIVALRLLLKGHLADKMDKPMVVYSSPFSRTIDTAALCVAAFGITQESDNFFLEADLRERGFGVALELQPYGQAYADIWAEDGKSLDYKPGGDGESVNDVVARLKALFVNLEKKHDGCNIVLCSHGDTLSIMAAAMTSGGDMHQHGTPAFQFENAQIKNLV
eukprot:gene10370-8310_t